MAITRQSTLNLEAVINNLENKAEMFVTAALGNTSAYAISKTPREYGNLANSQYSRINKYPGLIVGRLGYMSDYAAYLNGLPNKPTPNWSPRAVSDKEGPSTNMSAKPGFLTNSFESPRQIAELQRLLLAMKI